MANTDRARKLLVRSALVTSATIATFVGAQNLAMLDTRLITLTATPPSEPAVILPLPTENTTVQNAAISTLQQVAPTLVIQKAAPSIIILRQSQPQGAVQVASAQAPAQGQGNAMVIQPPAPAQIAAPDPVIVQQPQMSASSPVIVQAPVQQPGRSSR